MAMGTPSYGWRNMPAIPSSFEIMEPSIEQMPPFPTNGYIWESKEEYAAAQYLMLRYDGTEGLRRAVEAFRKNPGMLETETACIYDNAYVQGYLLSSQGVACRLAFNTRRSRYTINWANSPRLKHGSLVALSTARDHFNSVCIVGVVASRPLDLLTEKPPKIDIFLGEPSAIMMEPEETLVMVTARTGYFEAVTHAMAGLQEYASTPTIFDKYLTSSPREPGQGKQVTDTMAVHVEQSPFFDLSCLNPMCIDDGAKPTQGFGSINMLDGAPGYIDNITMDKSQLSALHRLLTKEMAIIQGPPGTGKTFTSVAGIKAMLEKWGGPIIVSSHTNHALDQLLELCIPFAKLARLGSRSENPAIGEKSIYNLSRGFEIPHTPENINSTRAVSSAWANMRRLSREIQQMFKNAFPDTCMSIEYLVKLGVISQTDGDQILQDPFSTEGAEMEAWLHPAQLVPVEPRHLRMEEIIAAQDPEEDEDQFMDETGCYEWDAGLEEDNNANGSSLDTSGLQGTFISLERGLVALTDIDPTTAKEDMHQLKSILTVDKMHRGAMYNVWSREARQTYLPGLFELLEAYNRACRTMKDAVFEQRRLMILEMGIKIIGCTTTGLTKYRKFLGSLNPRILIIEEAAETFEANITAGLLPSLRQVTLVGDHKQLKPSCEQAEMGKFPYSLNMSMFERLVEHVHVPYVMLRVQRRMAPPIRTIIDPFYGDDLEDHPEVFERALVPGMGDKRVWFFNHSWPESNDYNNSKRNTEEAKMVAQFANYLYLGGTDGKRITILTFYNGQRKYISSLLRRHGRNCKVSTVDSYQGEENDIVLLSLVRSNTDMPYSNIGFLKEQNRAVVACSRARCGFFVFGNVECVLTAQSSKGRSLWTKIITQFARYQAVLGIACLPVYCKAHGKQTVMESPDGFVGYFGGCNQKCGQKKSCGHICQLACHPRPHEEFRCPEPCAKMLQCGHYCMQTCGMACRCASGCLQFHLEGEMTNTALAVSQVRDKESQHHIRRHYINDVDNRTPRIRETCITTPLNEDGIRQPPLYTECTGRDGVETVDIVRAPHATIGASDGDVSRSSPSVNRTPPKSGGRRETRTFSSSQPAKGQPAKVVPKKNTRLSLEPHRKWEDDTDSVISGVMSQASLGHDAPRNDHGSTAMESQSNGDQNEDLISF